MPEDLAAAPRGAVTALAQTLDVPARGLFDYAVRAQTRGEHRLVVRAYAGFRPFSDRELGALGGRFENAAPEQTIELLTPQLTDQVRPSNPTPRPTTNLPPLD